MSQYLRLIRSFIRVSFQQETAFRANFFINLLYTILGFVGGLAGVSILFSQVQSFQGWSYSQTLALLGVFMLVGALQGLFITPSLDSLGNLGGEVWQGTFDFTLLKPINTQFLVSFRAWRLWRLVDVTLSLVILGRAIAGLQEKVPLLNLALFLLSLFAAMLILYSIQLLLTTIVFYYQGVPMVWVFGSLIELGRYPVGIYPGWVRLVLTWVVPVAFITTVPVQTLAGQAEPAMLLGSFGLAIFLFLAASTFFRSSLRRYTSASS